MKIPHSTVYLRSHKEFKNQGCCGERKVVVFPLVPLTRMSICVGKSNIGYALPLPSSVTLGIMF